MDRVVRRANKWRLSQTTREFFAEMMGTFILLVNIFLTSFHLLAMGYFCE